LTAFSVEPFSRCAADVLAFRNANRPVAREQQYFEWRYRRPCAHEPLIVWAVDDRGQKVGTASLIPHDFFVLDGVYPVGLLGDISVLPDQRGRGIASRMLAFLAQHQALKAFRCCAVLPNDGAVGALERAGWRGVTAIDRFVNLLDTRPLLERKLRVRAAARVLAAAANAALAMLTPERWPHARLLVHQGREVSAFDIRYDALWRTAALPGRVLALRNAAYLTWRYTNHPLVKYRTFELLRGADLAGYVVFDIEGGVVWIDDFLAGSTVPVRELLQEFLIHVRRRGLGESVQIRYNRRTFFAVTPRYFGFMRRGDRQALMVAEHGAATPELYRDTAWFLTRGDKDV